MFLYTHTYFKIHTLNVFILKGSIYVYYKNNSLLLFCNLPFNNQFTSYTKISNFFPIVSIIPVQFWLHPAGCKVEIITYTSHVYFLVAYIDLLQKLSPHPKHDIVPQRMKKYIDGEEFSKVPKHHNLNWS